MIPAVLFTDEDPPTRLGLYQVLDDALLVSIARRMFVRTGEQIAIEEGVLAWEFIQCRAIPLDNQVPT